MDLVVEIETEEAWLQAGSSGVLVVPREAQFAEEEWSELLERWRDASFAERRACVVVFVDRNPGRARVCFDGDGLPCFAGDRLDAAMGRLLEEVVDGNGFADGAFATWTTACLPLAKAGRVAAKARRLDRFARDRAGARAFEDGGEHVTVWQVHAL